MTTSPDVLPAPPTTAMDRTARLFRAAALVEAVSWTCLLVAMLFKYVVVKEEIGVQVVGPIHGVAFLAYVGAVFAARKRFGWSARVTLLGLVASIPPLATWPFERAATRKGLLATDG